MDVCYVAMLKNLYCIGSEIVDMRKERGNLPISSWIICCMGRIVCNVPLQW
jgi:hypothetical protein